MDNERKKSLKIKIGSLTRTLKEYKGYKSELSGFDMTLVGQDKKQT